MSQIDPVEFGAMQTEVEHLKVSFSEFKVKNETEHFQQQEVYRMSHELLELFTGLQEGMGKLQVKVDKIIEVDNQRKNTVVGFMAAMALFGGLLVWGYYGIVHYFFDSFGVEHKK